MITDPETIWVETYTGQCVRLIEPDRRSINIHDIAISLSRIPRYAGHTERFYSVAEHSILVADCLTAWGLNPFKVLGGLLHDAHEAYMGDLTQPMKIAVGIDETRWKTIESNLDYAIAHVVLGDAGPDLLLGAQAVKMADLAVLKAESTLLMPSGGKDWDLPPDSECKAPPGIYHTIVDNGSIEPGDYHEQMQVDFIEYVNQKRTEIQAGTA